MSGRDSIQSLLVLRKLTRAVTDVVRVQMTEYLRTLTPLMRPKAILGEYIQGGPKEPSRKADNAFKDLQTLYEKVGRAKPFNLMTRELAAPLNFAAAALEITPLDYTHTVQTGGVTRQITVRQPLTWVLTYTDFAPHRLQELVEAKARSVEELQRFLLSYLIIHLVTTNEPGLMNIFEALHFPLTTSKSPEFGELPVTRIGFGVTTTRPSDEVLLESAELTGMDAFEEVVDPEEIARLRSPLKDQLVAVARQHT